MRLLLHILLLIISTIILVISINATLNKQNQNKQAGEAINFEIIQEEIENETQIVKEASASATQSIKNATVSWYDRSACGEKIYGEDCYVADYPELFDEEADTVAHKSMGFGTRVRFCNGNICTICRVNDRGPYVAGREFDLSWGCAKSIGILQSGVAQVSWEVVNGR